MRHLLVGIAAAMTIAVIGSAGAQAPPVQPQGPQPTYPDTSSYRYVAPTPDDAYRQGLITRWELERLTGPTPPALQGPSVDGSRSESVK